MRGVLFVSAVLALFASGYSSTVARAQAPVASKLDYQTFVTQIEPIFLKKRIDRARCYVCHSQGTPFRLQELSPGATMWNDEQSQKNFAAVQRLVVPGQPAASRLLLMPLAEEAGGAEFHPGGRHFMSLDDPEAKTLMAWISAAK